VPEGYDAVAQGGNTLAPCRFTELVAVGLGVDERTWRDALKIRLPDSRFSDPASGRDGIYFA